MLKKNSEEFYLKTYLSIRIIATTMNSSCNPVIMNDLASLFLTPFLTRFATKPKSMKIMRIEGMMCEHCERAVKNALEAVEGVESAEASHEKGEAIIKLSAPVEDEMLISAVVAEEYEVLGISDGE